MGNDRSLEFEVYDQNQDWNDVPGLYIFAYRLGGSWYAVYVGQAESFQAQLPTLDQLDEAVREGATHIHAKVVRRQAQRDQWAQALIQHLQPPLNKQFV